MAALLAWTAPMVPRAAALADLPARLTDAEFWKLIEEFSEPSGTFRSDNLLSNEIWFQTIIPELRDAVVKPGARLPGCRARAEFQRTSRR